MPASLPRNTLRAALASGVAPAQTGCFLLFRLSMTSTLRRLSLLLGLLLLAAAPLCRADISQRDLLKPTYRALLPAQLPQGLALVDLRARAASPNYRMLAVQQANGETEQVKVSVAHGVTGMYAYPGEKNYINLKVETSDKGQYAQDRVKVLAGQRTLFDRSRAAMTAPAPFPGVEVSELSEGERNGVEYHALLSNTPQGSGMIILFVPRHEIIVTAYVLGRMTTPAGSLEATRSAQRNFLFGYIDAITAAGM